MSPGTGYPLLTSPPGTPPFRAAYGMREKGDPLAFLLRLHLPLADQEAQGQRITPPDKLFHCLACTFP